MKNEKTILVTGAAGFIGSAFTHLAVERGYHVVVLDALTYAGNKENLTEVLKTGHCEFYQGQIQDMKIVQSLFEKYKFDGVFNFAAESHVDNSITGPKAFVETNVLGTFTLLEGARQYWNGLQPEAKKSFRFLHVSTDEVFGSLGPEGAFTEETPYAPNSPYSATKAGSDHLVRAWFHTYGLPTLTTNCSNNYGPRQYPEKLIPRMILNALHGKPLPVYGNGMNVRDWIHVEDHSAGVLLAFEKGLPGSSYCFGGRSERNNLEVVKAICTVMDEKRPRSDKRKHDSAIQFVTDRLGHDFRYAIDDSLAQKELGFERKYKNFESGLSATIQWYLENTGWLEGLVKKGVKL